MRAGETKAVTETVGEGLRLFLFSESAAAAFGVKLVILGKGGAGIIQRMRNPENMALVHGYSMPEKGRYERSGVRKNQQGAQEQLRSKKIRRRAYEKDK